MNAGKAFAYQKGGIEKQILGLFSQLISSSPFGQEGDVSVSEKALANFLHKVKELEKKSLPGTRNQRAEEYTLRWIRWAEAGLSGI